jgi:hypothetical protein
MQLAALDPDSVRAVSETSQRLRNVVMTTAPLNVGRFTSSVDQSVKNGRDFEDRLLRI